MQLSPFRNLCLTPWAVIFRRFAASLSLHVTTVGHETTYAMAHRSLDDDRARQWRVLLVSNETFSSGRRRLSLGATSRRTDACAAESLRYALSTLSCAGCAVRIALSVDAARNRRRRILGNLLRAPRLRSHPRGIHALADFFRVSLLGRNPHRAMDSTHHGQRVFPSASACNYGQAANRTPRLSHPPHVSRISRLRRRGIGDSGGRSELAHHLAPLCRELSALR